MPKKTTKTKVKHVPHTPGPWVASFNVPTAAIPGHIIYEGKEDGFPIASLWVGGGTNGKPTQVSNAYLIAAAPELLDALKCALPIIEDAIKDAKTYGQVLPHWNKIAETIALQARNARAIIAKAEGKTSTLNPHPSSLHE
jgi:hypothetical protein